uniref:Protein of unassigned function n=1 Tax=Methylobacterium oryzae CBMB20 TaxID=693986 RepID=A0A088B372_9HYPH|nr:protein of unassigned function [Methylobacterium oryzae CBMB20]
MQSITFFNDNLKRIFQYLNVYWPFNVDSKADIEGRTIGIKFLGVPYPELSARQRPNITVNCIHSRQYFYYYVAINS